MTTICSMRSSPDWPVLFDAQPASAATASASTRIHLLFIYSPLVVVGFAALVALMTDHRFSPANITPILKKQIYLRRSCNSAVAPDLMLGLYVLPRLSALRRVNNPPHPSINALIQNTAGMPIAVAINPNSIGPTRRMMLSAVSRKPIASPERPCADPVNMSIIVIGAVQPMPSPNTNEISASMVALTQNGTSKNASAPRPNANASTLSSPELAIKRGSQKRATNAAAAYAASTMPIADAESPAARAYTGL